MARVSTPVTGFTGKVAGVTFADGQGETDNTAALAYFARHGYTVEDTPAAPDHVTPAVIGDEILDLDGMKVDELKALAAEHGYDLGDAGKKAEIIDAIKAQIPVIVGEPVEATPAE